MAYADVEAALLTVIRKTNEFGATNSDRGDERILARGNQKVCILRFGGHRILHDAFPNQHAFGWIVNVDLWFKNRGEISFYNRDIAETVQNVLAKILAYPTLDSTSGVTLVQLGDASDPVRWQGEIKNYWVVTFPVEVTEKQIIAILEV